MGNYKLEWEIINGKLEIELEIRIGYWNKVEIGIGNWNLELEIGIKLHVML